MEKRYCRLIEGRSPKATIASSIPSPTIQRARSRCDCQQAFEPSCVGSIPIRFVAASSHPAPAPSASSNAAYRAIWRRSYSVTLPRGAMASRPVIFFQCSSNCALFIIVNISRRPFLRLPLNGYAQNNRHEFCATAERSWAHAAPGCRSLRFHPSIHRLVGTRAAKSNRDLTVAPRKGSRCHACRSGGPDHRGMTCPSWVAVSR